MSMFLAAKAFKLKVGNPLRKLVLVKLADNANDDGICFPSYQYIADVCEISRRSVINHIDELIEMGLISKKSRKNKDGSSSNLYQLHLEKGSENPALGGANVSLGSATPALGGSAAPAPITNHSFNQSINHNTTLTGSNARTRKSQSAVEILAEFGITDQLAEDFIAHRKSFKATITKTALQGFQREADKAGISIQQAVAISIERSWRGFKAHWDWRDEAQGSRLSKPDKPNYDNSDTEWIRGMEIKVGDETWQFQ
ncbi:DNA-binding protein [Pasteurellaceae bacterium Pebbles2]|nr:DNA-binding protein [Pasteurellaceae bacterium Pebbles2]